MNATSRRAKAPAGGLIFLTGMMGSGKTTVGRLLAKKLHWRFQDTDRMVERRAGKPVAELFRLQGAAGFRRLESIALRSLKGRPRLVVATGGGIVLKASNRRWMAQNGLVLHLDAPVSLIIKRLGAKELKKRPLLKEGAAALWKIAGKRKAYYREAKFRIRAWGAPEGIVRAILLKIAAKKPLVLHDKTAR